LGFVLVALAVLTGMRGLTEISLLFNDGSQGGAGSEDPAFDGADREVKHLADLVVIHTPPIAEHKDRALLVVELRQRGQESGAVLIPLDARLSLRFPVVFGRACAEVSGGGLGLGSEAFVLTESASPEGREAGVHGDADHPGGELASPVEVGEVLNDFDEGVLGGIAGGLAVVEHAETNGVELVLVAAEEFGPSVGLASADGGHEF